MNDYLQKNPSLHVLSGDNVTGTAPDKQDDDDEELAILSRRTHVDSSVNRGLSPYFVLMKDFYLPCGASFKGSNQSTGCIQYYLTITVLYSV